jgi:RsiW-degrading membrane proteinase PrsW (M82 family)
MREKNILKTGIFNILFQLGFLILMFIVGNKTSIIAEDILRSIIIVGIVFLLSVFWALFFYLQDRREPEPLLHITISFIAGMAAASLVAIPLLNIIFQVHQWIYSSLFLFILGSFFITAFIVNFLFYIVIRYGFYPLKEFDEPVDGMVYGAIIGVGFALVNSLHYLYSQPEFTLFTIAYIATTNILIYSGIGSLIGYAIGNAKFKGQNIQGASFIGVIVGVIVLGTYHLLSEFIFLSGSSHAFWLSYFLTMIYALLILLFCFWKMRKLTEKDLHDDVIVTPRFDLKMSVLLVILLVAAGIIAYKGLQGKKFLSNRYGISFYYPHSLSSFSFTGISNSPLLLTQETEILFAGEKGTPPSFSFSAAVHKNNTQDNDTYQDLLQYVEVTDTESFMVNDITIAEKKGKRIAYSYIKKPPDIESEFPELIKVYTDVISLEKYTFIFTYKASSQDFNVGLTRYVKILDSIKWKAL